MKLGEAAIGNLARMVCGDEPFTFMPYRSSSKLTAFFEGLDLDFVHDGSTRYWWVRQVLLELNNMEKENPFQDDRLPSKEIIAVIEHLLNINFYLFEDNLDRDKAFESINKILKSCKLAVIENVDTSEVRVEKLYDTMTNTGKNNQVFSISHSTTNKKETEFESMGNNQKKIFISHSTKDVKYVEHLIELIESMGVTEKQIFCSSFEPYGIPLGENFLERIKQELSNEVIVLFVLTQNFLASPICLCEMGATWVLANRHVPILIPPFDFSDIRGVMPLTQGFKINEPNKLNSFKDTILNYFNLEPMDFTKWERKRATFLKSIEII